MSNNITDVSALYVTDQSMEMVIADPRTGEDLKNAEGNKMSIMLQSKDSADCKRVIAAFRNKFKGKDPSPAASEKFGLDLLVAATTGFNNIQANGQPLEYSDGHVRGLYEKSPIIRNQVDKYVGADENFIQSVLEA